MEIQELRNGIKSIKLDYCTKHELRNDDVFEHNGLYYSIDNYVVLHNGEICENEESMYCEHFEEHFPCDEVREVYIYNREYYYSDLAISRLCLSYFNGSYYDDEALQYNGIHYLEDLGEYSDGDYYYHENDDCYYSYPETDNETDNECYLRGYHNGSHRQKMFDNVSPFRIGYEIEKEDFDVLQSLCINDFEEETDNIWRKESDGSLNDNGYELVSPTFEMDIDKIFEYINSSPILVKHINADISSRCGGHINLSKEYHSGNDIFNMVCGYTPLLYSLYYGRVDKNYTKGKSNKDLKDTNEKYQAIRIHDNRIEFRIISAVPNVQTLLWRTRLIAKMLEHPTNDVRTAYWHIKTKFKAILNEVYSPDRIKILNERIVNNTLKFEGVDLTKTRKNDNNNNDKN